MVHLNGLILPDSILDDLPDGYRTPWAHDTRSSLGGDAQWVKQHGLSAKQRSETLTKPYSESEWVYVCVSTIAKNLGSLPLRVNRGSKAAPEVVESGPLVALVDEPQPNVPGEQFWQALVSWVQLRGEAFILPLDSAGKPLQSPRMPASFEIAAPSSVKWRGDVDGGVWEFTQSNGQPLFVAPENVIQPKLWNPYDMRRGMSPLELATIVGEPLYQANLFNAALLRNNADPGGIITFEGKAPRQDSLDRMRTAWLERHQGPSHAGKPAWLSDGAKFIYNPRNHRDMQFMELQKWGRDGICAIYGVPKGIVTNDDLNYATAATQERALWTRTLIPLGRLITGWVNAWLKRAGVDEWIAFNTSDVEALRVTRSELLDEAERLSKLGYTANEINDALGLGMPDDADAPWRDEAWTTGTMVPFSAILDDLEEPPPDSDPTSDMPPADGTADDADLDADEDEQPGDTGQEAGRFYTRSIDRSKRREWLQDYQRRVLIPQEGKIARVGLRYLRAQRRDVLRTITEIAGRRAPGLTPDDVNAIGLLRTRWDQEIAEVFGQPFWDVVEGAGNEIARELGQGFSLDRTDPRWLEIHGDRMADMVQVNTTTVTRLRSTLIDGIANGENLADLRKRVARVFAGNSQRAFVIARTETGMLASGTRFQVMDETGVGSHEWVTAADDVVRETHEAIDGETVPIGDTFSNGLRHPHDPMGEAGEVINCRCDCVAAD